MLSQTITVPGVAHPFVQVYTYDELNRLKSAEETQNSTQTWKQTFTFDRYGNRNFNTSGTNTTTLPSGFDPNIYNPTVSTSNNRFSSGQGYSYDSAGNTTADSNGTRSFVYNAENKQVSVSESSVVVGQYVYDGDGRRVKKIGLDPEGQPEQTVFVYDAGGKLIGEYSTTVQTGTVAKTVYTTNDHLGSPRINTDGVGTVISRHDYHPFGEEIARAGYGSDTMRKQFTGYERDGETELDFAQARYHSYTLGRFNSPDPLYFQFMMALDPQRFNLYGYTRNSPLKWVDPDGEKLYLRGNLDWLRSNILYQMTGGQEEFDKYFEIVDGQVLARSGVDTSKANEGVAEVLALVNASENYLYFAGGDSAAEEAAKLVGGTTDKKGNLNGLGHSYAAKWMGYSGPITRGRIIQTAGREGYSAIANLANGDPVFAVIAWNYENNTESPTEQTGINEGALSQAGRDIQEPGIGKIVDPVRIFIHESAENREFSRMSRQQRSSMAGYERAHKFAIYREGRIVKDLRLIGGFAGGQLRRRPAQ